VGKVIGQVVCECQFEGANPGGNVARCRIGEALAFPSLAGSAVLHRRSIQCAEVGGFRRIALRDRGECSNGSDGGRGDEEMEYVFFHR
jgi:hypothetical protein